MKIIIPMTGYGSRFVAAGYRELKPLIRVEGKPIVEWIVKGMYSKEDEFIFVCRKEHLKTINGMKELLQGLAKNVEVIAIDEWKKNGPVYDILRVAEYITNDEPCIVNYCDVFLEWDWAALQKQLLETKCHGAIIAWTGFNPTLLQPTNVFGSCLVDENQNLIEIREKYDFERNRMKGYYSAGVYYFASGMLMKKYFQEAVDHEDMVNGEYYASLPYNYMVKDGLKVWVPTACKTFCNWGTPEDMEEYLFWIHTIEDMNENMNILIPMAGEGQRFVNAGYKIHKPVIPIVNRKTGQTMPMVCAAVSDLPYINKPNTNLIFVDRDFHKNGGVEEQIREYFPKAQFITTDRLTEGQACTCLLAKKYINNKNELLISACDNGLEMDLAEFEKLKRECDVIVFTNKSRRTVANPNAYGWMKVDEQNNITGVSVKRAISGNPEKDNAVIATFWFREGSIFVKAAEKMICEDDRINNEFYADEVIEHALQLGYRIKAFPVEQFLCWGTPEDYEAYNQTLKYWNSFYHSQASCEFM